MYGRLSREVTEAFKKRLHSTPLDRPSGYLSDEEFENVVYSALKEPTSLPYLEKTKEDEAK